MLNVYISINEILCKPNETGSIIPQIVYYKRLLDVISLYYVLVLYLIPCREREHTVNNGVTFTFHVKRKHFFFFHFRFAQNSFLGCIINSMKLIQERYGRRDNQYSIFYLENLKKSCKFQNYAVLRRTISNSEFFECKQLALFTSNSPTKLHMFKIFIQEESLAFYSCKYYEI